MRPSRGVSDLLLILMLLGRDVSPQQHVSPQQRPVVGIMYEGWHAHAYWGRGDSGLTVEDVLRSNGTLTLSDMAPDPSTSAKFYWHKEPADGFYCIYRKRPSEDEGCLPDCPNITATLTRHATILSEAGVDFIVADSTNFINSGPDADCFQLRPWEVLGEEWLALRAAGIPTPSIAIWQNLQDASSDLWKSYVTTYQNSSFDDLIFRDAATGKKVFFSTANPAPEIVSQLEALNFSVVVMWAQRIDGFEEGEWAFFSPCLDLSTKQFTSSVSSFATGAPCAQKMTTNAPIGVHGTALTVSPSYQLSYSSLPFQASGKFGGLTMKRQFTTVFKALASAADGSGLTLDYLFLSTFNEHIAQPQPNPYPNRTAALSEGLAEDPGGSSLWVDMFGDARTRDLEPTKVDGGSTWDLLLSCLRVLDVAVASPGEDPCSSSSPSSTNETCCDLGETDPLSAWVSVWSLVRTENGQRADSLLTASATEKDTLINLGNSSGWTEVCSPYGGNGDFCGGAAIPSAEQSMDDRRGPFLLPARELPAPHLSAALWRCYDEDTLRHFVTRDGACGLVPGATTETEIGFVSLQRNSMTPRSLSLCEAAGGAYFYHSLDGPCTEGDSFLEDCGFVH